MRKKQKITQSKFGKKKLNRIVIFVIVRETLLIVLEMIIVGFFSTLKRNIIYGAIYFTCST